MRKRRWSYIIGGFVALTALAFLLVNVWQHSDYYLEIPELKAKGESIYGERAQVRGNVAEGSITDDVEKRVLTFTMIGNGESLAVVYEGIRPNNFDDGVEVVVEGSYGTTEVFDADKIITKCPSKYEPAE